MAGRKPETPAVSVSDSPFLREDNLDMIYGSKAVEAAMMEPMHKIDDRVWLGSLAAAGDYTVLEDAGITHVVNCLGPEYEWYETRFKAEKNLKLAPLTYLSYSLDDSPAFTIGAERFEEAIRFIDRAIGENPKNSVLVHCAAGASRSATIAAAYLMRRYGMRAEQAVRRLQRVRPVVNPNVGFRRELLAFEATITLVEQPPEVRAAPVSKPEAPGRTNWLMRKFRSGT